MEQLSQELSRLVSYLILGIVQGVTEVFPISSSAHLAITSQFLSETLRIQELSLQAAVVLHFGTFLAILFLYWQDVTLLWRSSTAGLAQWINRPTLAAAESHLRVPLGMLCSLAVTAATGLALKPTAEDIFPDIRSIPALMVVNGIIIVIVARLAGGHACIADLRWREYLLIGLAQGISVLPGISRFGLTLCAGLMCGLSWFEALKLSFLLSLPTFLGAIALELSISYFTGEAARLDLLGLLIGIAAASGVGYAAIRLLLKESLDTRSKFRFFGHYCVAVGLFFFLFFNYLPAAPR